MTGDDLAAISPPPSPYHLPTTTISSPSPHLTTISPPVLGPQMGIFGQNENEKMNCVMLGKYPGFLHRFFGQNENEK